MRIVLIVAGLLLLTGSSAGEAQKPAYTSDIITLREYVDVRFDAQQKAVEAALASADRAVVKAETAADKRFDSVNEFRKTLTDETQTFVPRAEYGQAYKALEDKVADLTVRVNANENRSVGSAQTWAYMFGALGFIMAGISFVFQVWKSHQTVAR